MLRGGAFRGRVLALVAYYIALIVVVGPMCVAQAGADARPRIPVRISLNVAMRTHTTDIATFTTPFPITVGVASDGTFTITRDQLEFALVDVLPNTPTDTLGRLTVRASAVSDFSGALDPKGGVTLDGFLQLLWSMRPSQKHHADPRMLDCPVGPFGVHLSTSTVGGTQLTQISRRDPSMRSARLVDDNLDVHAVADGTKTCAGFERRLNRALALPILPKPAPTTTTVAVPTSTTTTTTVPVTTTTTIAPTTTATTVAVDPVTDPATDTTTTTIAADPIVPGDPITPAVDPAAASDAPTTTPTTIDPNQPAPVADALGVALDPKVLAFEPIPSIVSTLTIAAVPPANPITTPTTQTFVQPRTTPTSVKKHVAVVHAAHVRKAKVARHPKRPVNKHAQTDSAMSVLGAQRHAAAPPLYFSPAYFAPRKAGSHDSLFSSIPLVNLGAASIARHRTGLSILFVVLLVLPLITFGLGLVAADLGWRPWFLGRRRRPSGPRLQ